MFDNSVLSGNKEVQKEVVVRMIMDTVITSNDRGLEKIAYDLYFGHQESTSFDYLTKVGKYYMPAKVRMMNIIKPYFDILESTLESRPRPMRVYAIDDDSVRERDNARARALVDKSINVVLDKLDRINMLRQQIEMQKQQIAAQAEGGQMDPIAVSALDMQLSRVESQMQRYQGVYESDLIREDRKFRYTFSTRRERKVNDALEYLSTKYNWDELFMEGFRDQLITDNQIYKINDVYAGQDPTFRRCNVSNVWYNADHGSPYLDLANWIVERRYMRPESVIEEFGSHMTEDQILAVKNTYPYPTSLTDMGPVFTGGVWSQGQCADDIYSGSQNVHYRMVEVYDIEWKTVKKVRAKQNQDKYGNTHTHVIGDNEAVKDGEKLLTRYITEYWRASVIMNQHIVNVRKAPFQHRDVKDVGKAYSSYTGYAFNGMDRRPYSRVLAVRDIQTLYNLTYYQIELLQALGGMRGIVMDQTQKPAHLTNEEWLSYLKRGLMLVDPSNEAESIGRPTRFNQYTTYDLTFGNSIQQLREVLDILERMVGRVLGIPPQRLGEMAPRENVGTGEMAIAQSNLTTEVLFNKDDRIKSRLLTKLINVMPFVWRDGKRGAYVMGNDHKAFNINKDEINDMRFELFYGDGGKEQKKMQQLMDVAWQEYSSKQTISLSQLTSMFNMNTLGELEESLEYFEELAERRVAGQQEQAEQARAEAQERTLQLKAMLDSKAKEVDYMKQAIQEKTLELEKYRIDSTNQVKLAAQGMGDDVKREEVQAETAVEAAYLEENKRQFNIDARLRQMEMMLEGLTNGADSISSSTSKEKIKD